MLKEIYKLLERPYTTKYGEMIQRLILLNILINIFVSFAGDIFYCTNEMRNFLQIIENITVAIFIIELLARYLSIGIDSRYSGFKGRVYFTFTPFVMIDIISLIPYLFTSVPGDILIARLMRFLKFFKSLKLLRLKDIIKRFFSVSAFSSSSILVQISVLFIVSIFVIMIFSFAYSGDKTSLVVFLDPPALSETTSNIEMFFGILELMLGLIVGGTLISIITKLITNITNDIKNGYYPYKGKGHIVIINHNSKLEFILKEINYYYDDLEYLQDVVIFLPFVKNIEDFGQNLKSYKNLNIILLTGDELKWNSYDKLNINHAKKILILKSTKKNMDIKMTRYIVSHENFNNSKLAFTIEIGEDRILQKIYEEVFSNTKNIYVLIDHNIIIQRFLNRSIIEPDYFKIYLNLLSYEGYEFYRLDADKVFKSSICFNDACMQFSLGILVGIRKEGILFLNPSKDTLIDLKDKLVVILEDKIQYELNSKKINEGKNLKLIKPCLKIAKKICMVGNYDIINKEQITQFMTDESIDKLNHIVLEDGDYIKKSIWDKLMEEKYDTIILNMEDDYEFMLTMYLKNIYKSHGEFLNRFINIIHNPTIAKLLQDKEERGGNIILSEKLVGKYATQVMFNYGMVDIFREVTQSEGNEFYILEPDKYKALFSMGYQDIKINLLQNDMIYIGAIKNDEFLVNYKYINEVEKIVVLTEGI